MQFLFQFHQVNQNIIFFYAMFYNFFSIKLDAIILNIEFFYILLLQIFLYPAICYLLISVVSYNGFVVTKQYFSLIIC